MSKGGGGGDSEESGSARESALALLQQSLTIALELHDLIGQSNVLEAMGVECASRGEVGEARKVWQWCLELREEVHFEAGATRVRSLLRRLVKPGQGTERGAPHVLSPHGQG